MKKFLVIFLALLLVAGQAFAALTPTVTSKQCYEDSTGTSYCRVLGTLAFDSTYPGNATTGAYGEPFAPSLLGLSSISKMDIGQAVDPLAGLVTFKYNSKGFSQSAAGATSVSQPNVRAYIVTNGTGAFSVASFVSAPSYDFSALTAVPFEAVGPVL